MKATKIFLKIFIAVFLFILSACDLGEHAITVFMVDVSQKGTNVYTINVSYQEEESYKNLGTDILIASNVENLEINIKKEYEDSIKIMILEKNKFYSLSKLFCEAKGKNTEYNQYKNALNTTFMLSANKSSTISLKAVVGDLTENKSMIYNTFDISKVFELAIK